MRCTFLILAAVTLLGALALQTNADTVNLGTAGNFSVLAGSAVTNTGATTLTGDLGIYPNGASSITGAGSIILTGAVHAGDGVALQAQTDLAHAYTTAAGLPVTADLSGIDLDAYDSPATALTPGVYHFSSSAQLSGTLYLNAENDPNAQFIFQIGTTLTALSGTSVMTIDDGSTPGFNVFWQVGSSATLDPGANFEGNILALTSITLDTGATIVDGSALAQNGAVTLDSNIINNSASPGSTGPGGVAPLPGSAALVMALLPLAWLAHRKFHLHFARAAR